MVCQIYECKITVYTQQQNVIGGISEGGFLNGLIINEKGYQQEIKLARINNNFYEVKDSNVYQHQYQYSASTGNNHNIKSNLSISDKELPSTFLTNKNIV